MNRIVDCVRDLKPLWDTLHSHRMLCNQHKLYKAPLQFTPSHEPIIPFPHPMIASSSGVTYKCSIPGMEQWCIHIMTPNHSIYSFPLFDMFVWMSILYHQRQISPNISPCLTDGLHVFIYPNKRAKKMPSQGELLGPAHINSAYTYSCPAKGEIIIYRTEELFKVFLHETMHVAGYDFSGAPKNTSVALFGNHQVATYESYAEFWARIWNLLFTHRASNARWSASGIARRILAEQEFAVQQLIRILHHNRMQYSDLIDLSPHQSGSYREKTNVLAYYVGTAGMLVCFRETLLWCRQHASMTTPIYIFASSARNIQQFHMFLYQTLRSPAFIKYVQSHHSQARPLSLRMSAPINDKCTL